MKLSRRDLLKWGATGMGLAAGGRSLALLPGAEQLVLGGQQVSRTTAKPRRAIPSTCLHCPGRCGIIGFLENGTLVKIEGNPEHPNNRGRICARGHAGLNHLYSEDRVLQPLQRIGARGEKRFKPVSWDEACAALAEKLAALRESGRSSELVFHAGLQAGTDIVVERFLRAFGAPMFYHGGTLASPNKATGQMLTYGAEIDINDAARSHYLLNFGANPYECHPLYVSLVQRIAGGRASGAKLVTFDVRLSNTAGRSDEWFAPRPGTDAVIALAMARTIMDEGVHDAGFIDRWTNYSSQQLFKHLAPYTPEMAERVSGIGAADIRRIALEFASSSPATVISGGGACKHVHGVQTERCVALLSIITGNVDVPGGNCLPRRYRFAEMQPAPPTPPGWTDPLTGLAPRHGGLLATAEQPIGAYIAYKCNPAYAEPDAAGVARILADERRVRYVAVIDNYITETAAFADLILPATTYLEGWGVESPPSYEMVPFVALRQPLVQPRGASRQMADVCIELAHRIGGEMSRYLPLGDVQSYLEVAVSSVPRLMAAGGLSYLRQRGVWWDPNARPTYRSYEIGGFETPSGKIELYSGRLEAAGQSPLPVYQRPPRSDRPTGAELTLVTFHWNVHTAGRTAGCKWLSEVLHNNPVWVHPRTAAARGITHRDLVSITSPTGTMTTRALCTEGIHPDVIAIGDSCGHWEYGAIARARKLGASDPDGSLVWWTEVGNGACPNPVVPTAVDEAGHGQAWMSTRVTLVKASPHSASAQRTMTT